MASFFATPEETQAWVAAEVSRRGLVMYDETDKYPITRCYLPHRE